MIFFRNNKKIIRFFFLGSISITLFLIHGIPAHAISLQIPIPGAGSSVSGIDEYISIIAQWIIGALSMLAVIFIMMGGIIWLTAAGSSKQVERAKKMITDAFFGLALAFGSYMLLATINPSLVDFSGVNIEQISEVPFEPVTFPVTPSATPSAVTDSNGGSGGGSGNVPSGAPINITCDRNLFSKYGFPQPSSAVKVSQDKWNIMGPVFAKASQLIGIEMPFIAMWPVLEGYPNADGDNCDNSAGKDHNPNTYCSGWDGGCEGEYWQVGYGIWPGCEGTRYLKEAFQKMYGDTSNAKVVEVGNRAILNSNGRNKITFMTNFPNISLDSVISGARNGNKDARMQMATLMKDPAISAYLVGKHFKNVWNIGALGTRTAEGMHKWTFNKKTGSYGSNYYVPEKVAKYIAGVCMAGKSSSKK